MKSELLKVLHLTDLHLDDITSTNEKLRVAFYKEFLDGLKEKVSSTIGDGIDMLLCTGDFVNVGKVENYQHAKIILEYLCLIFSISKSQISLCIGNHDFDLKLDKSGQSKKARSEFYELESEFNPQKLIIGNEFFKIYLDESKDIYILTFDSTYGCSGENIPSQLEDIEIDNIISAIDTHVPSSNYLFILSHYPMILFNRSQIVTEEIGWVDNHLWKSGNLLVERIYNKRKSCFTFWFFGDGHIPDFWSYNDFHHFLMTGMLGGNFVNPTFTTKTGDIVPFNKTNESKVVLINNIDKTISINTYQYKSRAHKYSPHTGYWEHTVSDIRLVDNPFLRDNKNTDSFKGNISLTKSSDTSTSLISQSVQEEIINQVRERRLYKFDRYATSESETTLAWISLTDLFESNELLSRCIQKSIFWLSEIIDLDNSATLFIGIDFWGSIFSSQASVIRNVSNYCVASKARSKHNALFEKPEYLKNRLSSTIQSYQNIVLFTDVVSTGNTVVNIKDEIIEVLELEENKFNWIAVSIISDIKQIRNVKLNKFKSIGSLCTDLRIPILENDELPDVNILPIKYDLR